MVANDLIYDLKLSSVVPSKIRVEEGENHELSGKDMAMKLHYITSLHFFEGGAVEGLNVHDLKKPMFEWLDVYYPICGRIRRHEEGRGRFFVRCNDSGVRIVEAKCAKTLEEWLSNHAGDGESNDLLVYDQQMLAHDLGFTPLVFLQLTWFKCGGLCLGMKWAHILGDAFTALNCINTYGDFMNNQHTAAPKATLNNPIIQNLTAMKTSHCKCLKILDPLGDNWIISNQRKTKTRTLRINGSHLLSGSAERTNKVVKKPFECICGIIWRSLAKVRANDVNNLEPKIVTVVRKKGLERAKNQLLGNSNMVIGTIDAQDRTSVADSDPLELANLIAENFIDETGMVEKLMDSGEGDFVMYGANLTFVDLEDADMYGLSIQRCGPVHAELGIKGIGDEGVVLVMPLGHEHAAGGESARTIRVILPEDELQQLTNVLKTEWDII